MQGEAGASCRQRNKGRVPLSEEDTAENSLPLPISLLQSTATSSSLASPPTSPSSSSSGLSTSSSAFSSSSLSSSSSSSSRSRRSTVVDQRRRSKPMRERYPHHLPKPFSEPAIPSMQESFALEAAAAAEEGCMASHATFRRCMTDTDFKTIHGVTSEAAPDLLQLFNIFQFNTPQKPPDRMLVNVTLVGNIQAVRLLVAYDASVQDVIKASLKGYAKEGRLPRHCIKSQTYGLHYSPFCLESIDPTEMICNLGTRSFYLFPRGDQLANPTQDSKERKPWWNILSLLLT